MTQPPQPPQPWGEPSSSSSSPGFDQQQSAQPYPMQQYPQQPGYPQQSQPWQNASTPPLDGTLMSTRLDTVAQGMAVALVVSIVLDFITLAVRIANDDFFGAITSVVLLAPLSIGAWALWSARHSTLVSNDWGLARTGWSVFPTLGSAWRVSWRDIAGASIVQGQRNLMLVVKPQPPQGMHPSRWLQGVAARLSTGGVMCPLDPQAAQGVHDLLRSRGIPEIR